MKKNKSIALSAILLLALILRLISINQSFWLDEAINVLATRDRPMFDILINYAVGDFHPPLYHILLRMWFKLFSVSEFTARLPSIIFGVLTVFIMFKIGELVAQKIKVTSKIAATSALVLATSSLHIYYSQEARMYALAAFATTLSFYALFKLKERPSSSRKILYLASVALMLVTDYQPWLLLPMFLWLYPGITSIAVLSTIPWWPMLARQIERGLATARAFPAWESVVGKLTLKSLLLVPVKFLVGRTSIENNLLFAIIIFIPSIVSGVIILKTLQKKDWNIRVIQGWLVLPILIGALVALRLPIFSYFRFLFILPAFYLLFSIGLSQLSVTVRTIALMLIITTNIVSTGAYLFLPQFQREDWKGAVTYMQHFDNKNTLVVFPNLAQAAGFRYYNQEKLAVQDLQTLNLTHSPQTIFLVRYVSEIFDPQNTVKQFVEQTGYNSTEEIDFNGVLVWRYEKMKGVQ